MHRGKFCFKTLFVKPSLVKIVSQTGRIKFAYFFKINGMKLFYLTVSTLISLFGLKQKDNIAKSQHMTDNINNIKMDTATFGTGCFWCTEAIFQQVEGVSKVTSGYSGGTVENP